MHVPAIAIVLRGVIAEEAQIKEVGRARQEFEGREIAFVQRTGVGPYPANAVFLEKVNDLRAMPPAMAKLDRKAKVAWELFQEFSQRLAAILGSERGRQLNQDDLKLRCEGFDRAQKGGEVGAAIAQPPGVRDFSGKLTGKTKSGWRVFHPAPDRRFGGDAVEGGVDLNGRKIMRIEFQPARWRQIRRIKASSPLIKTPRASAEPDFLLCREIQGTFRRIIAFHLGESRPAFAEPPLPRLRRARGYGAAGSGGENCDLRGGAFVCLGQLDWAGKVATLRNAMKFSFRILILPVLIWCASPSPVAASVIFKPGEKAKYMAPGEEEMGGNARQLFEKGQEAEKKGDIKRAIKAYNILVRRHPKDTLAPGALYRMGQLQEQTRQYLKAAQSYSVLAEKFPKSERFDESIEALFRIGEMYLAGKKVKIFGIPFKASMEEAANIFSSIIRTAPYGKYTARATFDLGRAREKQGANEAALTAYQGVVEKFPNDPLAIDAQYQIGYIWAAALKAGTNDPNAAAKAKTGFQDFLYRYPNSEKSAQARENLKMLDHKQTSTAFEIARYYDKQKHYRAAAIYYNDVIRQQPGSLEGDRAKKRISELRAKLGDKALQPPAVTAAAANRKTKKPDTGSGPPRSEAEMHNDAPLPPPDTDMSLPPPASLLPDTTTAPPSSTTDTLPTPAPTPDATATPE
jgi:outer membrane protein assembly factor BamD